MNNQMKRVGDISGIYFSDVEEGEFVVFSNLSYLYYYLYADGGCRIVTRVVAKYLIKNIKLEWICYE